MKKTLLFAMCLLVLRGFASFAQSQIGLTVLEDPGTVNRIDSIIRLNLYLENDFNVGSIKFNVLTVASVGATQTIIIPARPVKLDNSTDTTKWTMDTTKLTDSLSRFLLIGNEPINYYAKADAPRKVMEFFLKINNIPFYGNITVVFTDITIKGLDDAFNPVTVTLPDITAIIHLGDPPPPDTTADSVFLRISSEVDRTSDNLKLRLAYKTKSKITKTGFVLTVTEDFREPQFHVNQNGNLTIKSEGYVPDTISGGVNYYEVVIEAPPGEYFAPADDFVDLLMVDFKIDKKSRGKKDNWLINCFALNGEKELKIEQHALFTIDIGEPPIALEAEINAEFLLDRKNLTADLDFYYTDAGFDTLMVKITLPDSVVINDIQLNFNDNYYLSPQGDNNYLLKIMLDRALESTPTAKKFLRINLGFLVGISGQQKLSFTLWQAKKGEYSVNVNAPDTLIVDFGKAPPPPLTVVYFLQQPTEWLSGLNAIRQRGYGVFTLNWVMNNTIETTGGINFEVPLPEYMSLTADALDLFNRKDISKNIDISSLKQSDSSWLYLGVYSSESAEKPLLPNPISKNPSNIMALKNRFDDLPDEKMIFNVDSITASGLDGRIINETKSMDLFIDFEQLYNYFTLGDINRQWGDGKLNQNDVTTLIKIINGSLVATKYQRKFGDTNKDGKLNSYDVTILQEWIRVSGIEDDNLTIYKTENNIIHFFGEQEAQLELYNYLGQLVDKQSGNYFDLNQLQTGLYFFTLNNNIGKIYIK